MWALISRIRSRPSNAHTHSTQETGVFNFSGSLCTVAHLHTLRLAAAQTARIDDCSADVEAAEAAACCAAFLWVAVCQSHFCLVSYFPVVRLQG